MREEREIAEDAWYDTHTKVNNGERLFLSKKNAEHLEQVVNEARFLFEFELRGLKFNGAEVLFYIKPADGFKLPEIMQWIKQTCASTGTTGERGTSGAPKAVRAACCCVEAARRAP
jgi:hypothetical protein